MTGDRSGPIYKEVSWKTKRTIFPHKCSVTGERIGWFTMAKKKYISYMVPGGLTIFTCWATEKGYMFAMLTEKK